MPPLMSNVFGLLLLQVFAVLIARNAVTGGKAPHGSDSVTAATSSGSGNSGGHSHSDNESGDEKAPKAEASQSPKRVEFSKDTPVSIGPTVFITGANTGIGLGFVEQLVRHPGVEYIFATYRDPDRSQALLNLAEGLVKQSGGKEHREFAHVIPIQMELADDDSIRRARNTVFNYLKMFSESHRADWSEEGKYYKTKLDKPHLNLLINNAGKLDPFKENPGVYALSPTREAFMEHFDINTLGPMEVFTEFIKLMPKREEIVDGQSLPGAIFISSSVASMAHHVGPLSHQNDAYGMSKAALNFYMKTLTMYPQPDHIISISICPGFVNTGMARNANDQREAYTDEKIMEKGAVTVEKSVFRMLKKLSKLKYHESGNFYSPWLSPYFKEQKVPYSMVFPF